MKFSGVRFALFSTNLLLLVALRSFAGILQNSQQDYEDRIVAQIRAGRLDTALGEARDALRQFPRSAALNQLLGVALFKKGLADEARAAFRRAMELDPTFAESFYNLALLELSQKNYADGAAWLEQFLRLEPDHPEAHLLLGRAYHNLNRTLPAIEQFKKAIALSPRLALAHYHLGYVYQSLGNLAEAREEFMKEVEVNPGFYETYWLVGNISLNQLDLGGAESWFRRAVGINPKGWEAHYGLARVFASEKRWPEAEAEFKSALETAPNRIETHYALARTYLQMGRKEDAEREYQVCSALRTRAPGRQSGIAGKQPN